MGDEHQAGSGAAVGERLALHLRGAGTLRGNGPPGPLWNEHAALSAIALWRIGAGELLDIGSLPQVVDLNASWFRRDELEERARFDREDPRRRDRLERRILPSPAQFAGLPDFSYTIYDWINKNALCPALPKGAPSRDACYDFTGWLGAGLNASHFGTQATRNYLHLHELALGLARRARDLRETLAAEPKALERYRDVVREAEWMALAYEGFAQHFLADRLATAHMWERWNAGDYEHVAHPRSLTLNFVVGAVAGILHGWESTFHAKSGDLPFVGTLSRMLGLGERRVQRWWWVRPLAGPDVEILDKDLLRKIADAWRYWRRDENPVVDMGRLRIPRYRIGGRGSYPGVGDNLLPELFSLRFGKRYGFSSDRRIPTIAGHRERVLDCLGAGWATVIRAFGRGPDGGFGIGGIRLSPRGQRLASLTACLDPYVTNEWMRRAWPFSTSTDWAKLARSTLVGPRVAGPTIASELGKDLLRRTLLRFTLRLELGARVAPGADDLARGGLGPFLGAEPGNRYPSPAAYMPPTDLDTLPAEGDRRGRDRATLYGFFSGANAPYWCRTMDGLLEELRRSERPEAADVCAYLANRVYEGTDPGYDGRQRERNPTTGEAGPLCRALGARPASTAPPGILPPGYVREPGRLAAGGQWPASVASWCRRVPILRLLDDPAEARRDLVAEIGARKETVELRGVDLGEEPGSVFFDCDRSMRAAAVVSWSDERIEVRIPDWVDRIDEREHRICITTADGRESVGRFVADLARPLRIAGRVVDTDGAAVPGARVTVELDGGSYAAPSDSEGRFEIRFASATELPDELILRGEKEGYATATRIVRPDFYEQADIVLEPKSKFLIEIEPGLHHLGNSNYQGLINSRFQRRDAEGVRFATTFLLGPENVPPSGGLAARLEVTLKGAQARNPVHINGTRVGAFASSKQDGSATMVQLPIDPCVLRLGENRFEVASSDEHGEPDDFEFANVRLRLSAGAGGSPEVLEPSKVEGTPEFVDADSGAVVREIAPDGRFRVRARARGSCTLRAARLELPLAFVDADGRRRRQSVVLVETAPASGVFETRTPLSVSRLGARAGSRITVTTGLRGTSLRVRDWEPLRLAGYRVESRPGARVPDLRVVELAFERRGPEARLVRRAYPVSLARLEEPGAPGHRRDVEAGGAPRAHRGAPRRLRPPHALRLEPPGATAPEDTRAPAEGATARRADHLRRDRRATRFLPGRAAPVRGRHLPFPGEAYAAGPAGGERCEDLTGRCRAAGPGASLDGLGFPALRGPVRLPAGGCAHGPPRRRHRAAEGAALPRPRGSVAADRRRRAAASRRPHLPRRRRWRVPGHRARGRTRIPGARLHRDRRRRLPLLPRCQAGAAAAGPRTRLRHRRMSGNVARRCAP